MKYRQYILLILIVIIFLMAGYILFFNSSFKFPNFTKVTKQSSPSANSHFDPKADLETAMHPATKGASFTDKRLQFEATNRIAVADTTIDITGCKANPQVIKAAYRSKISIKNNDNIPHILTFQGGKTVTIAANKTSEIISDFGGGRVQFPYTCDNTTQTVGVIDQSVTTPTIPPVKK